MTIRMIEITLEDGQRLVLEYDTEIEGLDNEALDAEVRAALVERPMYDLQTRPDGTKATFMSELTTIEFLRP